MIRAYVALVGILILVPLNAYAAQMCSRLDYSIGTIDERFHLSRQEMSGILSRAEAAWETPLQRDLFRNVSDGAVVVNLVYDLRQKEYDEASSSLRRITALKSSIDQAAIALNAFASSTLSSQKLNDAAFTLYTADEKTYNTDIAQANARGGASESLYISLTRRKVALLSRFVALKKEQNDINNRITMTNSLIATMSNITTLLNSEITKWNAAHTAHSYTEGVYHRVGDSESITIYQFDDTVQLVRVLAHELGHALGLDHTADPGSIMYHSNTGTSTIVQSADLAEYARMCQ